jgi:hypothetical protein
MRQTLSLALTLLMALQLAPTAFAAEGVASQITAMPPGTKIELRLKDKRKMTGATGAVSNSGFVLIDASIGEHQIAFDDVASVKRVGAKSHTTRNVLIILGIGVVVAVIVVVIHVKSCPLGCNSRSRF